MSHANALTRSSRAGHYNIDIVSEKKCTRADCCDTSFVQAAGKSRRQWRCSATCPDVNTHVHCLSGLAHTQPGDRVTMFCSHHWGEHCAEAAVVVGDDDINA